MEYIKKELKDYIENNIFPLYQKNDSGHNLEHIKYVIKRSIEFSKQYDDIDLNMVYTIASFHDIAHYIDKDKHEVLSADIFYQNKEMKKFFNEEERIIIKEAIEDHRASLEYEPRSDYGKIVSSADRNTDLDSALKRIHSYTITHYPHLDLDGMINRAYEYVIKKFGVDGYAKMYCYDKEYEDFKKEVKELLKSKSAFAAKYMQVNNITNIK